MASKAYNTLFVLSIISFFLSTTSSSAANKNINGFTIELIHRDSPKSPLFNNKTTPFQRINDSIHRSISRANHLFLPHDQHILSDNFDAELSAIPNEYVISYSIGTPPFKIFGIVDTGSDLVWTQCKPCPNCYRQNAPLFDPKHSKTYKTIPCNTQLCTALVGNHGCDASNICKYNAHYVDKSFSNGNLATDHFTLGGIGGNPFTFSQVVFGCGYNNKGLYNEKTSGVVALGASQISLVSQIDFAIEGKFSYCMAPLYSHKSSKMSFGQHAVVSGPGTVSTPLVAGSNPNYYYLTLEGISVGNTRIPISAGGGRVSEGNIVIDSGTTITILPPAFYSAVESEVARQMMYLNFVRVPHSVLSLCYRLPFRRNFRLPALTVHFKGADLKLKTVNAFIEVSRDAFCFAFRSFNSGSVYGNLAQIDFKVGYDRRRNTVSFKPVDCTTI